MLNYLKYYLSGLLLFLFVSCSQEQVVDKSDACSPYESVHVSAGMPLTRMTTDDGDDVVHFLWERGDLITLATADQQLPYVTNSDGASVTFHTAFGSAAQPDDVLKNIEGSVVYARYPYNNKKPIDVKSLTTPVTAGSPFLYAIGTISQDQLDLHFHHAMAYLRFHVKHDPFPTDRPLEISASVQVGWGSEEEFMLRGDFDYNSKCIVPVTTSRDLDIPYLTFMDSLAVFPVSPLSDTSELIFELYCSDADEPQAGQEEFYYRKEITKQLPTNGLQAGHVYDVYLDYRENAGDVAEGEPTAELPAKMFINGGKWSENWDWAYAPEMTPVHSHDGMFWGIYYFEAGSEFKFNHERSWDSGDNFGAADGGEKEMGEVAVGKSNVKVKNAGYYLVLVTCSHSADKSEVVKKIELMEPTIYLIGDTSSAGWETKDEGKFTLTDDLFVSPALVADDDVRMCVKFDGCDWWQSEFNVFEGKIEFRGKGGDQAAVPGKTGQKVYLNFKDYNGEIK